MEGVMQHGDRPGRDMADSQFFSFLLRMLLAMEEERRSRGMDAFNTGAASDEGASLILGMSAGDIGGFGF